MFSGLRSRLLLAILIPTLGVAALVVHEALRVQRDEIRQAIDSAQRLATNAALDFEQVILRTRGLLLVLSRSDVIVRLDVEGCTRFVRILAPSFLHVHNITVARPDGSVFCSAVPLRAPLNIATTESVRRALSSQTFAISEYSVARIDGHPVLFTSLPVFDHLGEIRATVTATLDLEWLAGIVARRALPLGGTLTFVDREGTVVARQPDALDWLGISLADRPGYEPLAARRDYGEGIDVDGHEALMAIATVGEVPAPAEIKAIVAVPKAPIIHAAIAGLTRNLAALGTIAALALAAALAYAEFAITRPLRALGTATRRIAGGDFTTRAGIDRGAALVRELAQSFNTMADELQRWQARHEASNTDLRLSAAHLRELSRRLIDAEEAERRNLSRELHDGIGQNLAVANMALTVLRSSLPATIADGIHTRIADTQKLLEQTGAQVRDVLADLRPPALDDYGLAAALRLHAESATVRYGVRVEYNGMTDMTRLPPTTETALFRVAQEAIHNAARHADAQRVTVTLERHDAEGAPNMLIIADDGRGFDVAHLPAGRSGLGLATMRERAEAVGAAFALHSAPGRGTRIEVRWS